MKKIIIIGIVVSQMLLSFSWAAGEENLPYRTISLKKLQERQDKNPNLIIIDTRGGKTFDGVMIKDAVNLPTHDIDNERLAQIVPHKDNEVVFYCTNIRCPASELAAYKANSFGYTNLYVFKEGIELWRAKRLPTNK